MSKKSFQTIQCVQLCFVRVIYNNLFCAEKTALFSCVTAGVGVTATASTKTTTTITTSASAAAADADVAAGAARLQEAPKRVKRGVHPRLSMTTP